MIVVGCIIIHLSNLFTFQGFATKSSFSFNDSLQSQRFVKRGEPNESTKAQQIHTQELEHQLFVAASRENKVSDYQMIQL